jgi:trehalose-6-phosphate synthase
MHALHGDGLPGAGLIGFYVQAHCNNLLNTVHRVKEYVAARQDERGTLILSRFTGAVVDRMQRMRKSVKEHNVYWWGGSLIGELCDLRLSRT